MLRSFPRILEIVDRKIFHWETGDYVKFRAGLENKLERCEPNRGSENKVCFLRRAVDGPIFITYLLRSSVVVVCLKSVPLFKTNQYDAHTMISTHCEIDSIILKFGKTNFILYFLSRALLS